MNNPTHNFSLSGIDDYRKHLRLLKPNFIYSQVFTFNALNDVKKKGHP